MAGAVAISCLFASHASGGETPEIDRPRYELLRFEEDWSGLAGSDLSASDDVFDRLKYLDLSGDGTVWLGFGGQVRSRLESWNNFGFVPGQDDTLWLNRLRYHADLRATDYVRVFVEGKNSFALDDDLPPGRRRIDIDEADLQNGFVDLRLPLPEVGAVVVRAGRQEMLLGNQRLVSPRNFTNVRRTFDGVSVRSTKGDWTVTGFWARLVQEQKYRFNESDGGIQFYGLYAAGKVPRAGLGVDLYFLGLGRDAEFVGAGFNGTAGREDRFTVGSRFTGALGDSGFDFEVEGAYQFGEVGSGDVNAFMVASQLGYVLPVSTAPRAFVGFDYASGDESSGGSVETFNPLFPSGHKYFGYIDTVGRQNVIDASTGVKSKLTEKLTASIDGHFFWRASRSDAFYAPGGVVRAGSPGDSRYVGAEVDLTALYQFDRHLLAQAGYSHFFGGSFLEESGAREDIDFVYLLLEFTF